MLPVAGKPILEHTIEQLKRHGITSVILAAGYKADVVEKHFGKSAEWGVDVLVSIEREPLGTAGPITLVDDKLQDDFLVLYGDEFIDFDISDLMRRHETSGAIATILTRPSTHPWDAHLIQTGADGTAERIITTHVPGERYKNIGNAAVYALSKRILAHIPVGRQADFMRDVFPKAIAAGERIMTRPLGSDEYVKDLGSPERFAQVEAYLMQREEIAAARAHKGPITAVFLDRDGVLNKEVDLLHRPDQLHVLPGVPEAVRILNRKGIKTIVVTNQPVIARGLCEVSALNLIHHKLQGILESEGARLDAIYYCPHHPETHHDGGIKELRRACDCRKPGIGMLMQAKREHGLSLSNCAIIGDSSTDIEAGRNAGIRTILVNTGAGRVKGDGPKPDHAFDSLLDAAKAIALGRIN
jgi:histidinol-phosphate phosphatase family protein